MKNMLESFIREGEMKVKRTGTCHGFTCEAMWVEDGGDKPDVTVSSITKKGLKRDERYFISMQTHKIQAMDTTSVITNTTAQKRHYPPRSHHARWRTDDNQNEGSSVLVVSGWL